jgi:oligopeptide transport system ATP-binding protein
VRGKGIGMIFQDPMTSLNPVHRVGDQIAEAMTAHRRLSEEDARAETIDILERVGVPNADQRFHQYPHEYSGGMRQRAMVAMAIANSPKLLIADEPTTALDVTIQAQILTLIRELQQQTGAGVIFITHDMGVVAEMCDEVAVMYAGRIVERGDIVPVFERSEHPYTKGLLRSIPRKGVAHKSELPTIEGVVPSLLTPPRGCRFADRCLRRRERSEEEQRRCVEVDPPLEAKTWSLAACHYPVGNEP